jgi:hypothetical protein
MERQLQLLCIRGETMSSQLIPTEQEAASSQMDGLSTWDEVRRVADELELKIHLASMDVRDRWHALEPRLAAFEHRMKEAGERASKAVADELEAIWNALRGIRDDVANGN